MLIVQIKMGTCETELPIKLNQNQNENVNHTNNAYYTSTVAHYVPNSVQNTLISIEHEQERNYAINEV